MIKSLDRISYLTSSLEKAEKTFSAFFDAEPLKKVISKNNSGKLDVKSGVMSIVTQGGTVRPGDKIKVIYPNQPHVELKFV